MVHQASASDECRGVKLELRTFKAVPKQELGNEQELGTREKAGVGDENKRRGLGNEVELELGNDLGVWREVLVHLGSKWGAGIYSMPFFAVTEAT